MSVFSDKLREVPRTIQMAASADVAALAGRLRMGNGRRCIAVGSGGSAVAASFFARCRATLGLGATVVATPMELVLSETEMRDADVWLFSAGASNPDIEAARVRAGEGGGASVTLITTRADGRTATGVAASACGAVIVLPVADQKDGFLATHSLVATTTALLMAANSIAGSSDPATLSEALLNGSSSTLSEGSDARKLVQAFRPGDTLLLLHDPQAVAVAMLVETSLWETGIAPVQRVDFRNFAHGRHVWLARHPDDTTIVAIATRESRAIWEAISSALPREVRRCTLDLGNAGRLRTAIGIASGLAIVDELGRLAGIDPGRPGRGDFAPAIYDHAGLLELVGEFTPAGSHKRDANLLSDPVSDFGICLFTAGRKRRDRLSASAFGALALDYDGTIVTTERRLEPPGAAIVCELIRLLDSGIRLGIATGRGGSAGDALRSALPERLHERVLMGYYNGAHLLPLSIRVEDRPPPTDEDIADLANWMSGLELAAGYRSKAGPAQFAIDCGAADASHLAAELARHPAVAGGRLKLVRSQHSVDIVATETSKLRVVAALSEMADPAAPDVLAIGDSGSPLGNDHELLSGPTSVSVNQVCGDAEGCWTLFGNGITGPDALHLILSAIAVDSGCGRLDLRRLGLDNGAGRA